mgnify:CR=1 FL=1
MRTFHLYKGFSRKTSKVGNFIKISIRSVKPEAFLKKKQKSLALFVRSKYLSSKNDGSILFYRENSCLLIKRKLVFRSKDVTDPADYKIRRKKLFFKFPGIL